MPDHDCAASAAAMDRDAMPDGYQTHAHGRFGLGAELLSSVDGPLLELNKACYGNDGSK
jgi:hypothetical protein